MLAYRLKKPFTDTAPLTVIDSVVQPILTKLIRNPVIVLRHIQSRTSRIAAQCTPLGGHGDGIVHIVWSNVGAKFVSVAAWCEDDGCRVGSHVRAELVTSVVGVAEGEEVLSIALVGTGAAG